MQHNQLQIHVNHQHAVHLTLHNSILHYANIQNQKNNNNINASLESLESFFSLRKCFGDNSISCFFLTSLKGFDLKSGENDRFGSPSAPFSSLCSAGSGLEITSESDEFSFTCLISEFLLLACCKSLLACSRSNFFRSSSSYKNTDGHVSES